MPTLAELGLSVPALDEPLSYPGVIPDDSGLLAGDDFLPVHVRDGRGLGWAEVHADGSPAGAADDTMPLDHALERLHVAVVADRHAVLAIGSNASPGQVARKLSRAGTSDVLPMLRVDVTGWQPTVAAHVSRPGYVPASVVRGGLRARTRMSLLLCDPAQLGALDATEPNYIRQLGSINTPVVLDSGERISAFGVYVSRHGSLLDAAGEPVAWSDETAAITRILELVPTLRAEVASHPEVFVRRCAADGELRDHVREELRRGGFAGPPPGDHVRPLPRYGDAAETTVVRPLA